MHPIYDNYIVLYRKLDDGVTVNSLEYLAAKGYKDQPTAKETIEFVNNFLKQADSSINTDEVYMIYLDGDALKEIFFPKN